MPEMIPVKSSNLAAVGYDEATKELTIHFTTGGNYIYANVPPEVYADMMGWPSVGRYFMQNIRNNPNFEARKA